VEDLGTISINIRELGGGGGGGAGSGNVGGGPGGGGGFQANYGNRLLGPLTAMQERISQAFGNIAGFATGSNRVFSDVKRTVASGMVAMQVDRARAAGFASNLRAELTGFLRAPTMGGYAQLMREGTATSTVINALGKTGKVVDKALYRLSVVGSVASVALAGLRASADFTAKRVEAVGTYSGRVQFELLRQQFLKLDLAMWEAAENGKLYARVLRTQTYEIQMQAFFTRELGRFTSVLSQAFSVLTGMLYHLGTAVLFIMNIPSRMAEALEEPFRYLLDAALPGSALYGVREILKYLGFIEDNTRKTNAVDPNDVNAWFQADIRAMTGKVY
jgi:hypothetical protein